MNCAQSHTKAKTEEEAFYYWWLVGIFVESTNKKMPLGVSHGQSGACLQLKFSSEVSSDEEFGSLMLTSAKSQLREALLLVFVPRKLPLGS